MPTNIVVSGAGIGGLAAALALRQRGHHVDVLEQAPVFSEIGAGIQLSPNVTRRLRALGLAPALARVAWEPEMIQVKSANDASDLAKMPLDGAMRERYGAPYLCLHRGDLHALLLDTVRECGDGSLERGARVEVVDAPRVDEASLQPLRVSCADARTWDADALVGADGLWSLLRRQVVIGGGPPRASAYTAWRALIDQDSLPASLRRSQVEVWLGPRLHAVIYPVRAGAALNVVVIAEAQHGNDSGKPAAEDDARRWDQASTLALLQTATGRCCAPLQTLLEAMPDWRAWSVYDRPPMKAGAEMVRGRIALLGDAAHPMVPYLAQGAGMAIEDAAALADAVGDADASGLTDAFQRYAAARWRRNAQVQNRAQRNAAIFHATGMMRAGRDLAMRVLGARLLDQPWLYAG